MTETVSSLLMKIFIIEGHSLYAAETPEEASMAYVRGHGLDSSMVKAVRVERVEGKRAWRFKYTMAHGAQIPVIELVRIWQNEGVSFPRMLVEWPKDK